MTRKCREQIEYCTNFKCFIHGVDECRDSHEVDGCRGSHEVDEGHDAHEVDECRDLYDVDYVVVPSQKQNIKCEQTRNMLLMLKQSWTQIFHRIEMRAGHHVIKD